MAVDIILKLQRQAIISRGNSSAMEYDLYVSTKYIEKRCNSKHRYIYLSYVDNMSIDIYLYVYRLLLNCIHVQ